MSYDLMRGTAEFTRTRRRQAEAGSEDDTLDHIRTEQRARAGDEVIVDPDTGEMFNVSQLHRDRSDDDSQGMRDHEDASGDEQDGEAGAAGGSLRAVPSVQAAPDIEESSRAA